MSGSGALSEWYAAEGEEAATRLSTVVRHIRERTRWRRQADQIHAQLYAGGPGAAGLTASSRVTYDYEPASYPRNICRAAVDTLVAKVAKHRPLPQVLTSHGNWSDMKRARKMSQFLEGEFYQQRVYEKKAKLIVRDAGWRGSGYLFVCDVGKRIVTERVPPSEILFDPWDARYGEPRNIFRVQTVDRGVLLARYGKARDGESEKDAARRRDAILDARAGSDAWDWEGETDATVDRVRIVTSYHLCDDEDAHATTPPEEHECTGRWMVAILGSIDLASDVWDDDAFPFAQLNYSDPLEGVEGQGAVELLAGWQAAINEQFDRVQEGHRMLGGGMILVPIGSDIVETTFHNGVVPIIRHQPGKPPQFVTPAPVNPAIYERERDMPIDALNELGLSQQSTMSVKQPGVDAGIAIQTLDDIESERHIVFGRAYETWNLDVARLFIKCAARIAKRHGDYAVSVPMKGGILDLSWKDVSVKHFTLRVFPSSLLPEQLPGRLDRLQKLFDAGIVDRATFMQQLGAPDLSAELDMETADRLNIDEKLEAMLDAEGSAEDLDEAYRSPSAYQNYRWAQKRAQQRLNRAEIDGAPDENMELLRRFISECQGLIDKETPPAPPAPTGPDLGGALPPAPLGPPPPPGGMPPMPPPPMPPGAGEPPPMMAA